MRVNVDEIRHVAELARLELSEEQLVRYTQRAARVLDQIAELNRLDTSGIEPMAHAVAAEGWLREDAVRPSTAAAAIVANAPAAEGDLLAVPKVL